ncbi:hypothetical protein A2U01_0112285, partial [Trifolium medium]|nr:hypothetical protein [Trifolium medium]
DQTQFQHIIIVHALLQVLDGAGELLKESSGTRRLGKIAGV